MNFIDKILLMIFLFPVSLFRKLDVNLTHLKVILETKLIIDNRRPVFFRQLRSGEEQKAINNASFKTMLSLFLFGILIILNFSSINDLTTKLTFFYAFFIFVLAAVMISDFTSVLIDTKDNYIILPKPVNDSTIVVARIIHITIHVNKLILPIALPPLVYLSIMYGIGIVLPFVLGLFFSALLSIFIVNAIYIIILKITKPANFKSVIGYFQIGFAILLFAFYQLVPMVISNLDSESFNISGFDIIAFFPPYWFADSVTALSEFSINKSSLVSILLAVFVPLLSIIVVIKFLAPAFTSRLMLITAGKSEEKPLTEINLNTPKKTTWIEKAGRILTGNNIEFAGFMFTLKMVMRSKDFKLKVFPSIGYNIVILFILFFQQESFIQNIVLLNSQGKIVVLASIYLCSLGIVSALLYLKFSDQYKAAWIFKVIPFTKPGYFLTGAVKSVILFFFVPFLLVFLLLSLFFTDFILVLNVIIACINMLAIISTMAYFILNEIPFTVPSENVWKGRLFVLSFISTTIPMIFGVIQFFVFNDVWFLLIYGLFSLMITTIFMTELKKRDWSKIRKISY